MGLNSEICQLQALVESRGATLNFLPPSLLFRQAHPFISVASTAGLSKDSRASSHDHPAASMLGP